MLTVTVWEVSAVVEHAEWDWEQCHLPASVKAWRMGASLGIEVEMSN